MTVSSSTNRVSYAGNGSTTVFPYTYKIFDQDDLTVILRAANGTETTKTITSDYTVSGVGNAGGGNVTMLTAPASGETLVILREQDLIQELDIVPNDPFPADSLEGALDKLTFMVQQHEETLGRTIKASRTNTITGAEFTILAADRANKVFAFDSAGDVSITQELGTYRGNWAAATAFAQRDIVKDTSNNNIYICLTAHTSTGAQPISSNADVAKWALLVDAASATTSASAAASSASAAATSESNAATSESNAATSESNAATSESNAATSESNAAASASSAATLYDNFDDRYLGAKATDPTLDNDGDALIDGALYFDTANNVMKVYDLGTTTWLRTTPTSGEQANIDTVSGISANVTTVAGISADVTAVAAVDTDVTAVAAITSDVTAVAAVDTEVTAVAGVASSVATVAGISANVTTVAGISANVTTVAGISADVVTVADSAANISTVATDIANVNLVGGSITNVNTVATNLAAVNSFAATYRIAASDPVDSLDEGDLVFNTADNKMKVYNGAAWQDVAPVATSLTVSQISDLTATASEINVLDGITATTAELNILDGITATTAELNLLDGVTATTAEINYLDITTLGTSQASKVVTADANGDVNLSEELKAKSYNETVVALSGTTPAIDCESGNVFTLTTSGNTTFTFTNPPATGTAYGFTLKVTAGGAHTLTWPASVDWAGGTAPDAPESGGVNVYVFLTHDGGTNWYGFLSGGAMA